MKKCWIYVVVSVLLLCMLTACGADDALVGKWADTEGGTTYGFVFEKDGKGMIFQGEDYRPISWNTAKGRLTVEASGVTVMDEAEYLVENGVLSVTYNGSTVIFVKK